MDVIFNTYDLAWINKESEGEERAWENNRHAHHMPSLGSESRRPMGTGCETHKPPKSQKLKEDYSQGKRNNTIVQRTVEAECEQVSQHSPPLPFSPQHTPRQFLRQTAQPHSKMSDHRLRTQAKADNKVHL